MAGGVVVPDRGGQGKEALGDADADAVVGASGVLFQVKLPFEGVVHGRFDCSAAGMNADGGRRPWPGRCHRARASYPIVWPVVRLMTGW